VGWGWHSHWFAKGKPFLPFFFLFIFSLFLLPIFYPEKVEDCRKNFLESAMSWIHIMWTQDLGLQPSCTPLELTQFHWSEFSAPPGKCDR
jgi:hypothetical protein